MKVDERLLLAPLVVAMRMPIIAAETSKDALAARPETMRTISEKVGAAAAGTAAAQLEFARGLTLLPWFLLRSTTPLSAFADLAGDVIAAALKPAARRVSRNHRRLSRRQGR